MTNENKQYDLVINHAVSIEHVWARMAALDGIDPKELGLYTGAMNKCVVDGSQWYHGNFGSLSGARHKRQRLMAR
jgi:hypothetical protein